MVFNPQPKPVKQEKKKAPGHMDGGRLVADIKQNDSPKKKKRPTKYRTSYHLLLTDQQISLRRNRAYAENMQPHFTNCECCEKVEARDHDHTLSQRMCKILKLVELIWDSDNWSLSCPKSHEEWEAYKSGKFRKHMNYGTRMAYLKKVAPQEYQKRLVA